MAQSLLQYALSQGFNPAQWGALQNYADYSGGGLTPEQVYAGYTQGVQAHDLTTPQPGVISVGTLAAMNKAGTPPGAGYTAPPNSLRGTGQITWNQGTNSWNTPQGAFSGSTYQPYVDQNALANAQWGNSYQNSNIPGYAAGYAAQNSGTTPAGVAGVGPTNTTQTPPPGTINPRTGPLGGTPPAPGPGPTGSGTPPPGGTVNNQTGGVSVSGNTNYQGTPNTGLNNNTGGGSNPNFLSSLATRPNGGSGYGFSRTGLWR